MNTTDQQRSGDKSGKRKQKRNKKTTPKVEAIHSGAELATEVAAVPATEVAAVPAEPANEVIAPATEVPAVLATEVAAEPATAIATVLAERAGRPTDAHPFALAVKAEKAATHAGDQAPAQTAKPTPPFETPFAGVQAIARAYRDYTDKSLENVQSLAAKLSAARSFDKAMEAQTEFARTACENFANDSRKIRELHRDLFWRAFNLPTSSRNA